MKWFQQAYHSYRRTFYFKRCCNIIESTRREHNVLMEQNHKYREAYSNYYQSNEYLNSDAG